ncbi:MAG: hypothetical protein ACJASU_001347 [Cognaticolwellia sp.]|jgi:hypothetical protein
MKKFMETFSKPSKQRNKPPITNKTVISSGTEALINKAAGTKINLLNNAPLATP